MMIASLNVMVCVGAFGCCAIEAAAGRAGVVCAPNADAVAATAMRMCRMFIDLYLLWSLLFVSQCLNGIERRRLPRRVEPEEHTNRRREPDGERDRLHRHRRAPPREMREHR